MTEQQAEDIVVALQGIESHLKDLSAEMMRIGDTLDGMSDDVNWGINEGLRNQDHEIQAGRVVEVLRAIDEVKVEKLE